MATEHQSFDKTVKRNKLCYLEDTRHNGINHKDGLCQIVNGTENTPADEREIPKFVLRRDRALATIVLSMEPTLLYLIGPDPEDPAVRFGRSWRSSTRRRGVIN